MYPHQTLPHPPMIRYEEVQMFVDNPMVTQIMVLITTLASVDSIRRECQIGFPRFRSMVAYYVRQPKDKDPANHAKTIVHGS